MRPEVGNVLNKLEKLGIKTILLTGNKTEIAAKFSQQVGIKEYFGEQMPADKEKFIQQLVAQGKVVAMIGDGINDAMALASSSVSVAMGSGTDIAKETAEIVLIGDSLANFTETLRIAHQCKRVITQNLVFTLLFDGVGIAVASAGFLPPVLAACLHGGWDVVAILNSCRVFYSSQPKEKNLMRHIFLGKERGKRLEFVF
eukprot:TRINITY_DN540_c0_g1_i1.p1 TRINITY_DN540_c0_g1~~TRINITY_DN540_c0_g1_i1.p1  ORF type:complete len:209 (+),score=68.37 TRINITY_DN540_c0_g1_i1:29-628(+)